MDTDKRLGELEGRSPDFDEALGKSAAEVRAYANSQDDSHSVSDLAAAESAALDAVNVHKGELNAHDASDITFDASGYTAPIGTWLNDTNVQDAFSSVAAQLYSPDEEAMEAMIAAANSLAGGTGQEFTNGDLFASNMIVARHILAGQIDVAKMNVTELAGLNATIGGISMNSNSLYIGTGTFDDANTPFYVDDGGDFSLGDKFVWDASAETLEISGTVSASEFSLLDTASDEILELTSIPSDDYLFERYALTFSHKDLGSTIQSTIEWADDYHWIAMGQRASYVPNALTGFQVLSGSAQVVGTAGSSYVDATNIKMKSKFGNYIGFHNDEWDASTDGDFKLKSGNLTLESGGISMVGGDLSLDGDVVVGDGASNEVILGSWPTTTSYQGLSGNLGYILAGHDSDDTFYVLGGTGKELRLGANNGDAITIATNNFTTFVEPITVTHYSNTVPEFRTSHDSTSGFGSYSPIGPCVFHSNTWRTLWYSDYIRHARPVRNKDGNASAPSTTFNNDPDTGIYRNSGNSWAVATGGAESLLVEDDAFRARGIYNHTTSSTSTVRFSGTAGRIGRVSSSLRYKKDVTRFDGQRAFNFIDKAEAIFYRSDLPLDADWGIIGFGAEPTAEIDELFAEWEIDVCVCGLSEKRRLTHLATETAKKHGYEDAGFDDWEEFAWEHPNECLRPQAINESAVNYALVVCVNDLRKRVKELEASA
jgi:hypothetical protein